MLHKPNEGTFDKVSDVKIGDYIKIIKVFNIPTGDSMIGRVTHIDKLGRLYGTWGCTIIDKLDTIQILPLIDIKEEDK